MIDIEKLISQMSLKEKIGQMTQVISSWITGETSELTGVLSNAAGHDVDKVKIGSTLGRVTAESAIRTQRAHLEEDRLKIPLLFMRDILHGYRTIYPIPLAMGCGFDPDLMEECRRMEAIEATVSGLHVTFAPMVDYVRDARWGRVMETCGEDAYLNGIMGAAQIRGLQGVDLSEPHSIAACVKHFAAYGGAESGRDYNPVEISEYSLREYYLPAYKDCLDAGAAMIMTAFNAVNGIPATANPWLMQKVLRDEWNFDGVLISDWSAVEQLVTHGAAKDLRESAHLSLQNQCDIEMCSFAYWEHIASLLEDGSITMDMVDRAVRRILELKQKLGLFDNPYHGASPEKERQLLNCPVHRDIARRAAEETAVLLKNTGVLPFDKNIKSILLAGPFADNNEIKGAWSCDGRDEECITVLEGIRMLLPEAEIQVIKGCGYYWDDIDDSGIDAVINAAREAEAVVLCVGEPQTYSGEGNCRTDIRLPGVQEELIRRVCEANANTAVVLFNGRPLVLTTPEKYAPAILEMWYPGSEGGMAAAHLLFGDANPCGKLTMSFPKSVGQCPIYYNYTRTGHPAPDAESRHVKYASNYLDCGNLPLYCFGFGLSYSKFDYLALDISSEKMTKTDILSVDITVQNTGTKLGKEVVQLYLRDHVGTTVRPMQELIGFQKIELQPGEIKTVGFRIAESQLRIWNCRGEFVSEPGIFSISTGYADHLLLTKQFRLMD